MKIVIIGGGPSGMMAAISSKLHHQKAQVVLLERNNQLGSKLKLTGGGRCNVTADCPNETVIENTPKNGKFLFSSLTNFGPKDIQSFFINEGCPLKLEDHFRVFPKSNKSEDIINILKRKMESLGIEIQYNICVIDIDKDDKLLKTADRVIYYDHLIIATGGITYPNTGSDGKGYNIAKGFGHRITELIPGEVPLVSNDLVIQEKILQGLSFKDVSVSVFKGSKIIKSVVHDLIFTHFGLSGPAALRASFYVQKVLEKEPIVNLNIDFLPNITINELEKYKLIELETYIISNGIPKRLINYVKEQTKSDNEVIQMIKKFPLSVYSTRGFNQAFVTNGGVSIKEIDPKTMKSKLVDFVSFCGEIIDINSFTGGFNITSAFSTGYTAGKYVL
jgi:predicted Rossmann fold flavoprotein